MNYETFKDLLTEKLQEKSGKEYQVFIQNKPVGENDSEDILNILNCNSRECKNLHLYPLYLDYKNKNLTVERIASIIFDANFYFSETVKKSSIDIQKVCYILLNYKKNEYALKNVAHIRFHDLAIVFCIIQEINEKCLILKQITVDLMKENELTPEELYSMSNKNMPELLQFRIRDMEDFIKENIIKDFIKTNQNNVSDIITKSLVENLFSELIFGLNNERPQMFILSNELTTYGAAVILYPDLLKEIAEGFNNDFYILPSSIHETILIPDSNKIEAEELKAMVMEINQKEVADKDILSDSVYIYKRSVGHVEKVI